MRDKLTEIIKLLGDTTDFDLKNTLSDIKDNLENINNSIKTLIDVSENPNNEEFIYSNTIDTSSATAKFIKIASDSDIAVEIRNYFKRILNTEDKNIFAENVSIIQGKKIYRFNKEKSLLEHDTIFDEFTINYIDFYPGAYVIRPFEPSGIVAEAGTLVKMKKWPV